MTARSASARPDGPRRILFFHTAQGDRLTGGPRMVYQLASSLDPARFEACFVSPGETALSRALREDGVPVKTVALPPGLDVYGKGLARPSPKRALAALRGIATYNRNVSRVVREFDPDLIWVSNLRTFLSIAPTVWRRRVPVVWNIWLGQESRGLVRFMNEVALRHARCIVTEYQSQAGEIFTPAQLARARGKLRTVYTGHEVPEWHRDALRAGVDPDAADPRPLVVGTMGAFSPRKNQRLFLEVARAVKQQGRPVRFAIAGEAATTQDEAYGRELKEFAREAGIEDAVDWMGWVENPHDFLDQIDVYVQSSEHEGLPGAVREAMLNGLPVIGTAVGGTPEIIVDGETGRLVAAGDSVAIVDAILALEANPGIAADMGRSGRRRAEKLFSRDAFLRNYQDVLGDVLDG